MAEFRVGQMQGGSPLLQAINISSQQRASQRAEEMQMEQFKWLREDRAHNKLKQELAGNLQGAASNAGAGLWDYQNDQVNNQALADLPFSKTQKAEKWQEYQQAATAAGVTADSEYFEAQWGKQKLLQDQNITSALSAAKSTSRLSDDEFNYAMRGGGENARVFNDYMSTVHPEIHQQFVTGTSYDARHETWGEYLQPKHTLAAAGAVVGGAYGLNKLGQLAEQRAPMEELLEKMTAGGGARRKAFMETQGKRFDIAQGRHTKLSDRAAKLRTQAEVLSPRTKAYKAAIAGAERAEGLAAQNMARMERARKSIDAIETGRVEKIAGLKKGIAAKKPWEAAAKKLTGGKKGSFLKGGSKALGYGIAAPLIGAWAGEKLGGETGRTIGTVAGFGAPMVKGAYGLVGKGGAKLAAGKGSMLTKAGKALMKTGGRGRIAGALLLAAAGGLGMKTVFND